MIIEFQMQIKVVRELYKFLLWSGEVGSFFFSLCNNYNVDSQSLANKELGEKTGWTDLHENAPDASAAPWRLCCL